MTDNKLLTTALQTFGLKLLTRVSQAEMCEALGLLDQKQMAAQLGLSYEAFRWRVFKGTLPKPAVRLGRRSYYSGEQANQLSSCALEMWEARTINEETHSTQGGSS